MTTATERLALLFLDRLAFTICRHCGERVALPHTQRNVDRCVACYAVLVVAVAAV